VSISLEARGKKRILRKQNAFPRTLRRLLCSEENKERVPSMVLRDVHWARMLRGFYAQHHHTFAGNLEGHKY
jgi:hypothetical protein